MAEKKRGRPKLPPGQGKRHGLSLRTTKQLRDQIKAASRLSGRSMAQEIEYRLERTFIEDYERRWRPGFD